MSQRNNWTFLFALAFCLSAWLPFSPVMLLGQDVVVDPAKPVAASTQDEVPKDAQKKPEGYVFTIDRLIDTTPVKDQGQTGTCWSFATASFVESEVMRMGGPQLDLSEMFIVRKMYERKAQNYLWRQGKTNFGEGALAHDYINTIEAAGLVPEQVFPGNRAEGGSGHDHAEVEAVVGGMLKALEGRGKLGHRWHDAVSAVLDVYVGSAPERFDWEGKSWTPTEFRDHLGVCPADYVNLTSFSHHPFGKPFVLEIPDNFSGGSFDNVPLDDLMAIMNRAIDSGYTVAWDGDVSESGFVADQGFAVLPPESGGQQWRRAPESEPAVDQRMRQDAFEAMSTTDDHLMHLVGRAHDQNGRAYYIVKNSWGVKGKLDGYVYLSEGYIRMKTMAISVHRDVLQPGLAGGANSDAGTATSAAEAGKTQENKSGPGNDK